jgi:eukaryotic-like serine/threonine-protein kinase
LRSASSFDCRTDLFSFGVVVYEMATRRKAFAGATAGVIQEAILNRAVDWPRELPPALRSIVDKALQKYRATRYQGASEIREELEHFRHRPQSARLQPRTAPVWRSRFGRRANWLAMTCVALVAIAFAFLWIAVRGRRSVEPGRLVPLTTLPGAEWSPTFSPDGSEVAFAWNGEKQDNFDIYVTVIGVKRGVALAFDL